MFHIHATEYKHCLCLQCQWILAFSIHFEIFQTLLFVFQLCVHHGELSLSQFTLKSRASSALARMAGGSDELLVTTVAQVQHLSFAKTNSQDRKTLQDCWIKFIVNFVLLGRWTAFNYLRFLWNSAQSWRGPACNTFRYAFFCIYRLRYLDGVCVVYINHSAKTSTQ